MNKLKVTWKKKIMSFINKYNWKEINFASHKNDCLKRLLLVLYVPYNSNQIFQNITQGTKIK